VKERTQGNGLYVWEGAGHGAINRSATQPGMTLGPVQPNGTGRPRTNNGSSGPGMGCFESAAIERAGRPGCIPALCSPEWFVTTGCTRRRNVNLAPNRHLPGAGQIDCCWSGESYPVSPAQTSRGKPDPSMRRQDTPHLRMPLWGKVHVTQRQDRPRKPVPLPGRQDPWRPVPLRRKEPTPNPDGHKKQICSLRAPGETRCVPCVKHPGDADPARKHNRVGSGLPTRVAARPPDAGDTMRGGQARRAARAA
jgi:hypothetical protein